jgi:exopolysaccharide biosynthesis protein
LKRIFVLFAILGLLSFSCGAATLKKVTFSEKGDLFRLVMESDLPIKYQTTKGNSYTIIYLNNITIAPTIPAMIPSRIMDIISISSTGDSCTIAVNYKYLTSCKITPLKNPNRLIADFRKISKMKVPRLAVPEIEKIAISSTPDKFKVILNLTSFVPYTIITTESGMILELANMNSVIKSRKIVTKDKVIPRVAIDQAGKSVIVSITQQFPSFYQIYKLENPKRLIVEFDKASKATVDSKDILPSLRVVKLIKGTDEGPATINALMVDQRTINVFPYISSNIEEGPTMFGAIGSLFTFWVPKDDKKYRKSTVGDMVVEADALAGVNGTYFGAKGEPLGILMVNGELISYSINDRTALIIDKNNRCYIDNVSLGGEAQIEGRTVEITGINRKRGVGEVIIYTPRFGPETVEDLPGTILSVVNGEVKMINRARGWIPENGYALSLDPTYYDNLGERARVGSIVNLTLRLTPLSSIPNLEIKHVIGGGPRLLKAGQVYISRNSEHFRKDVASSRTSRTAVGISSDGNLVFVTVDKCNANAKGPKSVGVTLEELAGIMKDFGCNEAMNLDGGSSSTMVVSGEVVNCPASGKEVPVSNGILIRKL